MSTVIPVILCGGSGTRLWPLSRGLYPKQFMELNGGTIFGRTLDRVLSLKRLLPDLNEIIVICNEEHRFLAASILQDKGIAAEIVLEPVGRNTAPAIAVAALLAEEAAKNIPAAQKGVTGSAESPVLLVLPSDHEISPVESFVDTVFSGVAAAAGGRLLTFGVEPDGPETGFGYIKRGEPLPVSPNAAGNGTDLFSVARFVEKPDAARAAAMLKEGGYYWNSGMFMLSAAGYLAELERHSPKIYAFCRQAWDGHTRDLDFIRLGEAFAQTPSDSIDYAVMERTDKAAVLPLKAAWSDLGSWSAIYENAEHDACGNAAHGDVLALDTQNSYLHSSHRLLTAVGVKDICVVETADAVLVVDKGSTEKVKPLLESLKKQGRTETDTHLKVFRPWGSYETLVLGQRFQVKRIVVKPGASLSLQMHHHRSEHWVVVRGTARVHVDEAVTTLSEDMSAYIPLGKRHRLENPGKIPLEIIEVQSGSYLGEDDIVRFDDVYGR